LFYRGIELYTDGNYQEALSMFKNQLQIRKMRNNARATFWKGETEYVLDNFGDATSSLNNLKIRPKPKQLRNSRTSITILLMHISNKRIRSAGNYFQKYVDGTKDDKFVKMTPI